MFWFTWIITGIISGVIVHLGLCVDERREFNEFTIQSLAMCVIVSLFGYIAFAIAFCMGLMMFFTSPIASRTYTIDFSKWKKND